MLTEFEVPTKMSGAGSLAGLFDQLFGEQIRQVLAGAGSAVAPAAEEEYECYAPRDRHVAPLELAATSPFMDA